MGRIAAPWTDDQIQFPPKHLALREDVHQLGVLVGEMLREQGGDALYDLVEGDRRAAIERRARRRAAGSGLAHAGCRPPARRGPRPGARVLHLVPGGQPRRKVHRIRRRREYFLADGGRPQPGGIEDALAQLKAQGLSLEEVLQLLATLRIQPILVAHPTESTRRTQLRRQQRMADALARPAQSSLDPQERRHIWARLRTEITTGWQTEEHPRQRLTVADEREYAMFHFAEVLYRIVPTFYEEIGARAGETLRRQRLATVDPPIVLQFGTWVGGDMEGSPDVHAKTIRETLARQQQVIVNEYFTRMPAALAAAVAERQPRRRSRRRCGGASTNTRCCCPARVPWRRRATTRCPIACSLRRWPSGCARPMSGRASRYERVEQLRADLQLAAQSLQANRGANAGYQLVRRLLLRVDTFGFHLATLDLKQRADVHHRVIGQGMDDPQWLQRSRRATGCDC